MVVRVSVASHSCSCFPGEGKDGVNYPWECVPNGRGEGVGGGPICSQHYEPQNNKKSI